MGRKSQEISDKFVARPKGGALDELILAQHGVCAVWQVTVGRAFLSHRFRVGRLYRIHHGVYALVPRSLLSPNGHRMAAVLACGPGAALSHHSALKLRGLMDSQRAKIDVTVPAKGGRKREGIHIHRSATLRPGDVERVERIPCTTLARTIFDMAAVLTPRRLERLLDEMAYQEVLDLAPLNEQLERNRARPKGCGNLRRALAAHRPGSTRTDGPLGEEMLALIRSTDLPAPQVQLWIDLHDGEPMIQADFAYPEARLIIETDGQQAHGRPRRTMADYRRDQRAARAGWHTLRFVPAQIREEPERVKRTLVAVVRTRLRQRPPTPATNPEPARADPG